MGSKASDLVPTALALLALTIVIAFAVSAIVSERYLPPMRALQRGLALLRDRRFETLPRSNVEEFTLRPGFVTIGIGAWLGTIMLLNVWGIIWPNQKKILGIKPATDEEKARARKAAGMASRVNFVLSIPMLMCMASQSHGLPFVK